MIIEVIEIIREHVYYADGYVDCTCDREGYPNKCNSPNIIWNKPSIGGPNLPLQFDVCLYCMGDNNARHYGLKNSQSFPQSTFVIVFIYVSRYYAVDRKNEQDDLR